MRNWIFTAILALAVSGASFGTFYAMNREPAWLRDAVEKGDAMQWLRVEFKLSNAQFTAIRKLHEQYDSVCARHCAAIMDARRRKADPAELKSLEDECVRSMTEHFRRVAALMSPQEGRRYLAIVMPRVHDYDHRDAPNIAGRP